MKVILMILAFPVGAAIAFAWLITISRRATRLWAAANEADFRGDMLTMAAPSAANSGAGPNSGDPLVYGQGTSPAFGMACVAETSYTQPSGLVPTGNISAKFVGVFFLPVVGKTSIGGSSKALAIGDKVYADGGSYDPVTGCTYGFTLDANSSTGINFGTTLDPVVAGQTTTVRVKLKQSAG